MKLLRRSLVLAAAASCCGASAAAISPPPLPRGWSHAQINVVGPNGRPHTLIYDRGRVLSVGDSSLTLREPDRSVVTIQVAPTATIRIDGRPARRVQATSSPPLRTDANRLRTVRRR